MCVEGCGVLRWAVQSHARKARGAKPGQVLVVGVCGVCLTCNKMQELRSIRVYPCTMCALRLHLKRPMLLLLHRTANRSRALQQDSCRAIYERLDGWALSTTVHAVCCRAACAWAADTPRRCGVGSPVTGVCGALVAAANLLRLRHAHAAPSHRFCTACTCAGRPDPAPRWHTSVELHPVLRLRFYPAYSCCCCCV